MVKKSLYIFLLFLFYKGSINSQTQAYDPNMVTLARSFSKDLFQLNSIPFLKPMVEVVNATSNSNFFTLATLPKSDFYIKFSINGMGGFVKNDMKTFVPQMPQIAPDPNELTTILNFVSSRDTANLLHYIFLRLAYNGIHDKSLHLPQTAATILGNKDTAFYLPHDVLKNLIKNYTVNGIPVYNLINTLDSTFAKKLDSVIIKFPEKFQLSNGANINMLGAGVPQFEIGSLYGTELLLRGIPPVDMGPNIGKFAFWGIGLKHNITTWFKDFPFDLGFQIVYQGTNLHNFVGVTNAELTATAQFWDVNIHASKSILTSSGTNIIDIFTGFSYETVNINTKYKFTLPRELQWELGLLQRDSVSHNEPTPGFPGDTVPQTVSLPLNDKNYKWIIGLHKAFGNFSIYASYSLSKFNIIAGGLLYRFDIINNDRKHDNPYQ